MHPTHAAPWDLLQAPLPPQALGCRWSSSPAGLGRQGGTAPPRGAPSPLLPPNPGTSRLLAGCCGCPGREGQSWVQGESLHQPFPPSPPALSSWQRTAAEQTTTCTSHCCTCRAHRSPCERQPSGSFVSHNPPRVPPCPTAAWPQPRLLHQQQAIGPVAVEPRLPEAGPGRPWGRSLPPSPTPALGHHAWGTAPGSAPPKGGKRVAGLMWGSCAAEAVGFVTVCVYLELAGLHVRDQRQEKLQVIYQGV